MAHINVYTSLPRTVALGPDLDIDPDNWHWVHCLDLPLDTLNALHLSQTPYKWIRYAIGVVIGAQGSLSTSPDSSDAVDYNAVLPADSTTLYYHTSNEERQRMFPIDPDMMRTSIPSESSVPTTRRVQFREDVESRDERCILTELPAQSCAAAHLLAHSKGDVYISTFTQHRSRRPSDIVQEINSVRNAIFLNTIAHPLFGTDLAFLMTPNFALDTTDIDPTAPAAEKRCTAHVFFTPPQPLYDPMLKPHFPVRILDTSDFPPDILFDSVYAGTIVHHFGTQTLKETVTMSWKDIFYPNGVMNAADKQAGTLERAQERRARYESQQGPDTFDMLMMLPYILVPPNEMRAVLRSAKEKAEAAEQRRVQEKVDDWIRQVDTG